MAARQVGKLLRMDEHALDLGRLVGAPHPAPEPDVGAPAGGASGQQRRQVAGGEADQRVIGIEGGDDHLAHLAGRHRIACAGANDLDQQLLLDDETFLSLGLVGDGADVGRGIALAHRDAALAQPVAGNAGQGLAGHAGLA